MILEDRTTATNYELKIDDGEFYYESTASTAGQEPILRDKTDTDNYWKVFIDDGEFGWEEYSGTQNDSIVLEDSTGSVDYILEIDEGEFRYSEYTSTPTVDGTIFVYANVDDGGWQELKSHSRHVYPLDVLGDYRKIKFKIKHNSTAENQLSITGWEVETFQTTTRVKASDSNPDSTVSVYASIDNGSWQELTGDHNKYSLDSLGVYRTIKFRVRHNGTATQQLILTGWELESYLTRMRQ